jgi:hydrogenase maturation protease
MARLSSTAPTDSVAAVPAADRFALTIVGIGNEFRGDDAAGLAVLRQLGKNVPAGARTIELAGDQTYLLELMRSTDAVIVVDAVQSSAPAGTIFRIDASEEPMPKDFVTFSTHAIDSATVIELARALDVLPGTALVYGIVGREFSFTTRMTPEVAEALDVVRESILNDASDIMSGVSSGK